MFRVVSFKHNRNDTFTCVVSDGRLLFELTDTEFLAGVYTGRISLDNFGAKEVYNVIGSSYTGICTCLVVPSYIECKGFGDRDKYMIFLVLVDGAVAKLRREKMSVLTSSASAMGMAVYSILRNVVQEESKRYDRNMGISLQGYWLQLDRLNQFTTQHYKSLVAQRGLIPYNNIRLPIPSRVKRSEQLNFLTKNGILNEIGLSLYNATLTVREIKEIAELESRCGKRKPRA